MTFGGFIVMAALISFFVGVLGTMGVDNLIKRKKAHKQYVKSLEAKNRNLNRAVSFYKLQWEVDK